MCGGVYVCECQLLLTSTYLLTSVLKEKEPHGDVELKLVHTIELYNIELYTTEAQNQEEIKGVDMVEHHGSKPRVGQLEERKKEVGLIETHPGEMCDITSEY